MFTARYKIRHLYVIQVNVYFRSSVIPQAVTRRSPTQESQFRSQTHSMWYFWWTKNSLWHLSIGLFLFSPVSTIPPILRTHVHLHVALTIKANERSLGTFLKATLHLPLQSNVEESALVWSRLFVWVLLYKDLQYTWIIKS